MDTRRRRLLLGLALGFGAAARGEDGWSAVRPGSIVLFRHANAPGVGDPPGFRIDDCSTQRNLDADGRAQAARIGSQFRQRGIDVQTVWSSRWCRARDTADLAFPGRRRDEAAFDSLFGRADARAAQTAAARELLLQWRGPGVLVVTTHQININALIGAATASGEGVVLRAAAGELQVLGTIQP